MVDSLFPYVAFLAPNPISKSYRGSKFQTFGALYLIKRDFSLIEEKNKTHILLSSFYFLMLVREREKKGRENKEMASLPFTQC